MSKKYQNQNDEDKKKTKNKKHKHGGFLQLFLGRHVHENFKFIKKFVFNKMVSDSKKDNIPPFKIRGQPSETVKKW